MLFNILLVLFVTCFATATIPTTMLARDNKDVTVETVSALDKNENESEDEDGTELNGDDKEDELVSFDGTTHPYDQTSPHTFSFEDDDDDSTDSNM